MRLPQGWGCGEAQELRGFGEPQELRGCGEAQELRGFGEPLFEGTAAGVA